MRKFLLILLVCVCCCAQAQDVRTLFMEAPDSVFPLQPKRMRVELVEFANAGMRYELENALEGKSVIEVLADDYMLLRSSASSTVQVKLLPCGKDFVICVVNTVAAEAADSRIAFFDGKWRRLATASFFSFPEIADFFVSPGENREEVGLCDIYLVSLGLNKDNLSIVADYTMPDYMSDEDAERVRPLLRSIVYEWNGERFVSE